jgi:hypothetical protein
MTEERTVNIVFVREYKNFISAFNKKSKEDYVLNVNKIIKEKFKTKFIVPNKVQSFLLNYEIKKLLDKAINIKNQKYKQVIYLNSNLTTSLILNTVDFIEDQYDGIVFQYNFVRSKDFDDLTVKEMDRVTIVDLK